jgi:hypothetical protein
MNSISRIFSTSITRLAKATTTFGSIINNHFIVRNRGLHIAAQSEPPVHFWERFSDGFDEWQSHYTTTKELYDRIEIIMMDTYGSIKPTDEKVSSYKKIYGDLDHEWHTLLALDKELRDLCKREQQEKSKLIDYFLKNLSGDKEKLKVKLEVQIQWIQRSAYAFMVETCSGRRNGIRVS